MIHLMYIQTKGGFHNENKKSDFLHWTLSIKKGQGIKLAEIGDIETIEGNRVEVVEELHRKETFSQIIQKLKVKVL